MSNFKFFIAPVIETIDPDNQVSVAPPIKTGLSCTFCYGDNGCGCRYEPPARNLRETEDNQPKDEATASSLYTNKI